MCLIEDQNGVLDELFVGIPISIVEGISVGHENDVFGFVPLAVVECTHLVGDAHPLQFLYIEEGALQGDVFSLVIILVIDAFFLLDQVLAPLLFFISKEVIQRDIAASVVSPSNHHHFGPVGSLFQLVDHLVQLEMSSRKVEDFGLSILELSIVLQKSERGSEKGKGLSSPSGRLEESVLFPQEAVH